MIITFIYGLFSDQNVEKGDFSMLSKICFKLLWLLDTEIVPKLLKNEKHRYHFQNFSQVT